MLGLSRISANILIRRLGSLGVLGLFLVAIVYTIGVQLESNDAFCASCHVEPETTYYQTSLNPQIADTLAAYHAGENTLCIDCHSRKWVPGRLWAQWGGLQNLVSFWSGNFRSPSETTRPVGDSGCSKCHSDLTWVSERPGHYHSPWLRSSWRSAGGPVNTCEACHPSHEPFSSIGERFMDIDLTKAQCDACHDATGIGD
ncbi:MAG: hypothetical protein FVQ83_05745 [Chloroflexi bacterium]|nr:hypothetical protein [Chloroflexota bacterium]